MSNAKAGDIAVIVGDPYQRNIFEGCHLRVLADSGKRDMGCVMWRYEPLSHSLVAHRAGHPDDTICDYWLRPIRGDGLTAEEISTLYAPSAPEKVSSNG